MLKLGCIRVVFLLEGIAHLLANPCLLLEMWPAHRILWHYFHHLIPSLLYASIQTQHQSVMKLLTLLAVPPPKITSHSITEMYFYCQLHNNNTITIITTITQQHMINMCLSHAKHCS